MTQPPRRVEVLLESLGAGTPYAQDLIGDLAQEFSARAERDGALSAGMWYRREAMASVPHLIQRWAMAVGAKGIGRVLVALWITGCIYVVGMVMFAALTTAVFGKAALGSPSTERYWILAPLVPSLAIAVGYLAAWLSREAPLMAAAAVSTLALASTTSSSIWMVWHPPPVHISPWFRLLGTVCWIPLPIVGGVLRVWRGLPPTVVRSYDG